MSMGRVLNTDGQKSVWPHAGENGFEFIGQGLCRQCASPDTKSSFRRSGLELDFKAT